MAIVQQTNPDADPGTTTAPPVAPPSGARPAFIARLTEACATATRPPLLLVISLDRLDAVTESFGQSMTESVQQRAEGRIRNALRLASTIARLGENEFAAILTVFQDEATRLGAHVIEVLCRPFLLQGRSVVVGCSVGIAAADPGLDPGAAAHYHRATLALAQARRDGGNRCRVFDPCMAARAREHATLDFELRRALAAGEFEMHYQPQCDLETGRIRGFESLLRWRHPTRGLLTPGAFLSVAEAAGLMPTIGEWAIRTACQDAAAWPADITVGVNLDAGLLLGGRLLRIVEEALARAGIPAQRLDLEVTEGILMQAEGDAAATLRRLREMGVHISMDDFGTGFSSMTQLRKFPFSRIKIDRSLVHGIADDPNGAVFVRAVAMMGAGLGMHTVAEGVETPAELDRVRTEGCTFVQGYLTGRPLPAADAIRLLADALTALPPTLPPTLKE